MIRYDFILEKYVFVMTDFHYLDNSATTRTTEDVADVIYNILVKDFGNPSSLHNLGFAAKKLMTQAKKDLAKVLDCSADELYFTSGGTEANNWAISSGYQLRHRRAKEVITTAFEHSSVLDSVKRLEEQGATCHYVYPDKQGHILPLDVLDLVNENTALVSLMMVNNEIGTVLPIKQLCAAIKAKNPDVLIHCDAVQAFCKLPISLSSLGVDMLTVTGHKINA
ncbi:MAG: aminotransferase class V-fold PLP-dependent enzyme, partial [Oscillospiraceae bacterium]|nr:aminotransferase class V-fold PLP-dependent enzyme [Oscillospiraceae bacterium]